MRLARRAAFVLLGLALAALLAWQIARELHADSRRNGWTAPPGTFDPSKVAPSNTRP